jgi:hypothetical protein
MVLWLVDSQCWFATAAPLEIHDKFACARRLPLDNIANGGYCLKSVPPATPVMKKYKEKMDQPDPTLPMKAKQRIPNVDNLKPAVGMRRPAVRDVHPLRTEVLVFSQFRDTLARFPSHYRNIAHLL